MALLKGVGFLMVAAALVFGATAASAEMQGVTAPCITTPGSARSMVSPVPSTSTDDVLWDNGLPNGLNGLSCCYWSSYPLDREVADNFDNTEAWNVTGGHFRMLDYYGGGPEVLQGVNVFFYQDAGTAPSTTRYASPTATFNAYLTGAYYFSRPEIAVDVNFAGVDLAPGRWWVCFQPVLDDNAFWLTANGGEPWVFVSYPDIGYPKWTPGINVFGQNYDVSFQIWGTRGPVTEVIVDDTDPGFSVYQGAPWPTRSYAGAYGGSTHYRPAGSGSNVVAWRVNDVIPQAGNYDVYVWKFAHPASSRMATNAHYIVKDSNGLSNWILKDLSTPGDEWLPLGNFSFTTSGLQGVGLSDNANGYLIADAVKLVQTE